MTREITLAYEPSSDPREVRIVILANGRPWLRCLVRSNGPPLRPSGEALLCFGLLPAIELGCDLRIEEPLLLEHLRVCYQGGPNCGTCKKCVVTRICLDVLGAGRPVPSFPAGRPPLDPGALRVADTSARNDRLVLRAAAVAVGGHDRLVPLLDAAVAEFDTRRPSLAERLRLKERLRVARHRWRFHSQRWSRGSVRQFEKVPPRIDRDSKRDDV